MIRLCIKILLIGYAVILIARPVDAFCQFEEVTAVIYYDLNANNNPGSSDPNWYFYWSQALGVAGDHTYNGSLSTSQTVVNSATDWTIQIGSNASWPPPGNPPTNNTYIDGFLATNLHEFWHRDHRIHNFLVHGGWNPPPANDADGDGICDTDPDPTQPGQHAGGWEALIGTNPAVFNSTEDGGNWAEQNGNYGNDHLDWAHPGSQWP